MPTTHVVLASGLRVTRTPIIGSNLVTYSVWERASGGIFTREHSTITWEDPKEVWGKVTSRRLPGELMALKGPAFVAALAVHSAGVMGECHAAIQEAFPGVHGSPSGGDLDAVEPSTAQ